MRLCAILLLLANGLAWSRSDQAEQNAAAADSWTQVTLTKLSPPAFPPLARQARITGDVSLSLSVAPDRRVQSVEVLSGHPLLKQAAVGSAKKSDFTCAACVSPAKYKVTYTFAIGDKCPDYGPHCEAAPEPLPQVESWNGHVKVTVAPPAPAILEKSD